MRNGEEKNIKGKSRSTTRGVSRLRRNKGKIKIKRSKGRRDKNRERNNMAEEERSK